MELGQSDSVFLQYVCLDRNFLSDGKQICTHIPQKGLDSQQIILLSHEKARKATIASIMNSIDPISQCFFKDFFINHKFSHSGEEVKSSPSAGKSLF